VRVFDIGFLAKKFDKKIDARTRRNEKNRLAAVSGRLRRTR
jgi:hypothetical protein